MGGGWKKNWYKPHMAVVLAVSSMLYWNLSFCWDMNSEGLALLRFREGVVRDPYGALSSWDENNGEIDPCSWFGVECSDGKVVIFILRNNSFQGNIPKEIGELKDLEVLDIGFNNFSGPFPSDFGNNLSLTTLLLDNNEFLGGISPELLELSMLSEFQVDENMLTGADLTASRHGRSIAWDIAESEVSAYRKLLQVVDAPSPFIANSDNTPQTGSGPSQSPFPPSLPPSTLSQPSESPFSPSMSPSELSELPPSSSSSSSSSPVETPTFSPSESPTSDLSPPSRAPAIAPTPNPPVVVFAPPQFHEASVPSPVSSPLQTAEGHSKSNLHIILIGAGALGGTMFVLIAAVGVIFFRSSSVVTVKPWATGLSGQLQKAFVTGVPKLKRSELEAACEDFSNITDTFTDGTVYKGTLSTGVEIAVISCVATSRDDWSKNSEAQFRKKIETLSSVNHKNFVNLIGFCEEDKPFTRMMVFEYAPNGTLFEHLHIKESEHLDWGMRLRIAMGMAYCLEYMHQMNPPVTHKNLLSSSIYLTEDYAAKISDFSFWNDVMAPEMGSAAKELLKTPSTDPESNVYSFGIIVLEMITGKIPYPHSVDNGSQVERVSDRVRGKRPLKDIVDPTLKSFQVDELEKLLEVIQNCIHPNPKQRPMMKDIVSQLKEITAMGPEGATPKLSPLWWAELEIMSTEGS
ncbi:probable inactive receptor-like protein kinase At3g56050 isoform X2 [Tripterygium wilfordii]|uniref:probable inactive receptor-like protein kinase At3g56050 isoform X2 n=1 Tax=Tripterygium wilfordii TaxID=458696 RepID=UPI0018F830FB|nr:probable inactive receptor-like protein kinase At3g56050 isoform X2 [Tripterygium wilfordii]